MNQPALLRAYSEYARAVLSDYDIGEMLYRLTDDVTEVLEIDGAGVSLGSNGRLRFIAGTDDQVVGVEQQQIKTAEGPCQDAYRTGQQILCSDLTHESRWPSYKVAAVRLGVRAAAGIPMGVGDHLIGAVNLYSRVSRDWTAEELLAAQGLADIATGYIINLNRLTASNLLAGQLHTALQSRVIIEQAKGVLVERHDLDADKAFERLRRHARANRQHPRCCPRRCQRPTPPLKFCRATRRR